MEKTMEKCLKCFNNCKMQTETNAKLILCPKYLSKRSTAIQKAKVRANIPAANYRSL